MSDKEIEVTAALDFNDGFREGFLQGFMAATVADPLGGCDREDCPRGD